MPSEGQQFQARHPGSKPASAVKPQASHCPLRASVSPSLIWTVGPGGCSCPTNDLGSPVSTPGMRGKDPAWSYESGGAARPIWSAEGDAVCLPGTGSQRTPLLVTWPPRAAQARDTQMVPVPTPGCQRGGGRTLGTVKPRGLRALYSTRGHQNFPVYTPRGRTAARRDPPSQC